MDDSHSRYGSRKLQKLEEILNLVKDLQETLSVEKDEFDVYGEHVAYQLRNIADKKSVAQVRRRIDDVLYAAVIGEYNWKQIPSSK